MIASAAEPAQAFARQKLFPKVILIMRSTLRNARTADHALLHARSELFPKENNHQLTEKAACRKGMRLFYALSAALRSACLASERFSSR